MSENYSIKDSRDYPVLLVDDNLDDVFIVKRLWKKWKIRNKLHHIADGEEALNYLINKHTVSQVSLVLLDLSLPRINGFEILEKLRKEPSCKDLPIIVLSGSERSDMVERCHKLGCDGFIEKPITYDILVETLAKIQRPIKLVLK